MELPSHQDLADGLQRCLCPPHDPHTCSGYLPRREHDRDCYHRRDWGNGFYYCDWFPGRPPIQNIAKNASSG